MIEKNIEIIYDINGAGKTYLKNKKEKDNKIIAISSRLEDWHNGSEINKSKIQSITISEHTRAIDELKNEMKQMINEALTKESPLFTYIDGTPTNFKGTIKSLNIDLMEKDMWEQPISKPKKIEVNSLTKIFNHYEALKNELELLSDEERMHIFELSNVFSRMKTKRDKFPNKKQTEIYEKYNSLIIAMDEKMKKGNSSKILKDMISKGVAHKYITTILENTISETKNEYITNIKNILSASKFANKILENIKKRKDLEESKMKFNKGILKEINEEFEEWGEIEFVSDDSIKISSKTESLSSGQFTVLAASAIMANANNKEIIIDDAFETLDEKHSLYLTQKMLEYNNIKVLTHTLAKAEIIKEFAQNEGIDIGIKNLNNNDIKTWSDIFIDLYNWAKIPEDEKEDEKKYKFKIIIFTLIKILTRYYAKNGRIHSNIGTIDIEKISESPNEKNWRYASNCLFHYNNKIESTIANEVFPFITLEKEVNSVELIEKIICSLKEWGENCTWTIKASKLINYLELLKKQLEKEKLLFDWKVKKDSGFIIEKNKEMKTYFKLRKEYNMDPTNKTKIKKRDNVNIHLIDYTPEQLTDKGDK